MRCRLIPLIVIRLIYIKSAARSSNHALDDFLSVMMTSIHVNLSIVVACIPFIKPVMESLQTGLLASDVHTAAPLQRPNYALRWLKESSTRAGVPTWPINPNPRSSTEINGPDGEEHGQRGLSISSRERMVIKQTKTVDIEVDNQ